MKRFAALFAALDETMRTNEKVDAMVSYFADAPAADAAWAVYFLSGGRPKRRKVYDTTFRLIYIPFTRKVRAMSVIFLLSLYGKINYSC